MVRSLSEKLVHIYENTPTTPRYETRHTPPVVVGAWSYKLSISRCHAYEKPKTNSPNGYMYSDTPHQLRIVVPGPVGSEMVQTRPRCSSKQVSQCPIATAQNGMNPVYSIYKYYSILLLYIYTTTLYSLFFALFKYVSQKKDKEGKNFIIVLIL